MIKIKKFENIFGIKRLINGDKLDKTNVIYAPNGTAKTSIADGLEGISDQSNVSDVIDSSASPDFEIDVDGASCTQSSYVPFSIIKYSGVDPYDVPCDDSVKKLAISSKLMKKVDSAIKNIQQNADIIKSIVLGAFPKKQHSKAIKAIAQFLKVDDETNDSLFAKFADLNFNVKQLATKPDVDDFIVLANPKVRAAVNDPIVKAHAAKYFAVVSKQINDPESILDGQFDVNKLKSFFDAAVDYSYFDSQGNRLLKINGQEYDEMKTKALVESKIQLVFSSPEAMEEFNSVKKIFSKNKDTAKAAELLDKKPEYFSRLSDFDDLLWTILSGLIGSAGLSSVTSAAAAIKSEQAAIDAAKKSTPSYLDREYKNIWEKFKHRFNFECFDLEIRNEFNAAIGSEIPTFVKVVPGKDIEIDDPKLVRLSTGETKTFFLINAILEIEAKVKEGKPFTVILDDAVDSFDYKNKYGIVDYLAELVKHDCVQLIVLTHNFDFYRSLIIALGTRTTKQFFAYRSPNDEIELHDVTGKKYYLSLAKFNDWKKTPSDCQYFALLPFMRNVFQLEADSSDPKVKTLDEYLHYRGHGDENRDFVKINSCFAALPKRVNLPASFSVSDRYLKKLSDTAYRLISSGIVETDLEEKICLGLYIRLFLERYMVNEICAKNASLMPGNGDVFAWTRNLIKVVHDNNLFSQEDEAISTEINIIAPSYIHANAFMYEPLIDVGAEKLVEAAKWIYDKNTKYPI